MYTEDEAKTKWCPHARFAALAKGTDGWGGTAMASSAVNQSVEGDEQVYSLCIASDCMAWRWVHLGGDHSAIGEPLLEHVPGEGYCGLAGDILECEAMTDENEIGRLITDDAALNLYSRGNDWLKTALERDHKCSCGSCHLCAHTHLRGRVARTAEAERLMTEALSWLTSYPGGGAMNMYDKFRAFLERKP